VRNPRERSCWSALDGGLSSRKQKRCPPCQEKAPDRHLFQRGRKEKCPDPHRHQKVCCLTLDFSVSKAPVTPAITIDLVGTEPRRDFTTRKEHGLPSVNVPFNSKGR
jgi:hypothetical protein